MTMKKIIILSTIVLVLAAVLRVYTHQSKEQPRAAGKTKESMANTGLDTATFASGCFWCVEAIFQNVKGVHNVVSGYSGGHVADPSYEEVCGGTTGHAEACQITYDPEHITYAELLEGFWKTHDPTTLNQQGNDLCPQYRSGGFYH